MQRMNKKMLAGMIALGLGAVGAAGTAVAQPYGPGVGYGPCWDQDGGPRGRGGHWREGYEQRKKELHDKLKLNASQEKAWNKYQETIASGWKTMQDGKDVDFSKMTAPERLEKMQQWSKERDARMTEHLEALKTFYGTLSAEQKKIFDTETAYGPYGHGGWGRGQGPRVGGGGPR